MFLTLNRKEDADLGFAVNSDNGFNFHVHLLFTAFFDKMSHTYQTSSIPANFCVHYVVVRLQKLFG